MNVALPFYCISYNYFDMPLDCHLFYLEHCLIVYFIYSWIMTSCNILSLNAWYKVVVRNLKMMDLISQIGFNVLHPFGGTCMYLLTPKLLLHSGILHLYYFIALDYSFQIHYIY